MGFWSKLFGGGHHKPTAAETGRENDLFIEVMIKTMSFVASSDGEINDGEVTQIATIYKQVTGNSVSPALVRAAIEVARGDTFSIEVSLEDASAKLTKDHIAQIMRAAVLVAAADDDFNAAETRLLDHVASSLGFPADRAKAMIDELRKA